ncbi:MAG: GDP-mannose 4,6-dehydratase [Rhodomicrobium sp.]
MRREPCLLLTGGTGFVGRYLAPALVKSYPGHRRVMLCSKPGELHAEGFEREVADIADEAAVDDLIERWKPETVIHLAAQSSVGESANAAGQTWRVNFGGSFALARAVARHAAEGLFFFVSSSDVYGKSFRLGRATEDTPAVPVNAYAASKLAAEMMLRDVLPSTSRLIVARAFNHSGPGQDERFVLPAFAAQIARIEAGLCEPRLRIGNLAAERDFLHAADVADAYVRLLAQAGTLPPRSIFNIASGQVHKIGDLLEMLRDLSGTPFEIEADPQRMRPSDIPRAEGDATLLRQATGWKPVRPVIEMLRELLDWWRARVALEA